MPFFQREIKSQVKFEGTYGVTWIFLKLPRLNYYLTSGPIFLAMLYRDLGKRILKTCDVFLFGGFFCACERVLKEGSPTMGVCIYWLTDYLWSNLR